MVQRYDRLRQMVRSTTLAVAGLVALMSTLLTTELTAQETYSCFPTCSTTDGRFLSIAGVELQTLAGDAIALTFGSPSTADTIEIGIFDGETGGYWDQGTTPLRYTLYADSMGNGTGTYQVGEWLGTAMSDNSWFTLRLANRSQARSANGNYFYTLRVRSTNPAVKHWSNFKVRTNGTVTLRAGQAFAITAPAFTVNDARILYPNYPNLSTTTYDGVWHFYLDVPTASNTLEVWDGDMDLGSFNCADRDTNDPDTPDNVLPEWAVGTAAVLEGVGRGTALCPGSTSTYTTGAPNDDMSNSNKRSPSVRIEVRDPYGTVYLNPNPSGNMEWEQFKISTATFNRAQMDLHADSLPAGIYDVKLIGMDMTNLNAWRFFNDALGVMANEALGVNAAGQPVAPLRPHAIAGTFYMDVNGDGDQDAGELPLAGVTLTLGADANNDGVVDRTFTVTTDSNGHYSFPNLTAGTFTLHVDTTDVVELAGVSGFGSTPNVYTFTLSAGQSDPTLNFGYQLTSPHVISGTFYYDQDSSGTQSAGESGVGGVEVTLTQDVNGDGNVDSTWTTTTDTNGSYGFTNLYYGTYTITVDTASLPAGVTLLTSPGSGSTSNSVTITIDKGDANVASDFTYLEPLDNAVVGGRLFVDANGNGTYDSGETSLANVAVTLTSADDTLSTTTDASGNYSFTSLPAGTYTISVDSSALVELVRASSDEGAAYEASVTVTFGEVSSGNTFAFERLSPHVVAGALYYDANGNGTQDSGEPVMSGVTVTLAVDANSDGTYDSTLTTTTSSTGAYEFSNLYSGNYTLTVASSELAADAVPVSDADGATTANTASFTVEPGSSDETFNFTYERSHPHVISGTLYQDLNGDGSYTSGEPVMSNVTVTLDVDANSDGTYESTLTATTNSSGVYSFTGLYSGDYRVSIDTAALVEKTATSDADGVSTPNTATITLSPSQTSTSSTYSFGYVRQSPHEVAGVLYYDANGNGTQDSGEPVMSGVTVTLAVDANSDGTYESTLTTTTSSTGAYQFSNLYSGNYTLTVASSGFAADVVPVSDADGATTANTASFTVAPGSSDETFNFTYERSHPHVISGTLYQDLNTNGSYNTGEPVLSNVTVRLAVDANSDGTYESTLTTTTNSSGVYSFSGLYSGNYRISIDTGALVEKTPTSDADGVSTPNTATITLSPSQTSTSSTYSFGYQRQSSHVVAGTLYYDANGNGVKDAGELVMSGVTVTLAVDANSDGTYESTLTTTTSSTGAYQFSNLYSGNYRLTVTSTGFAADVVPVSDADGATTANTATFTVAAGSSDATYNFTYQRSHQSVITGTLYYDVNSSGGYNTGEPYMANVTVRLAVDANSDGTYESTLTTTTNSSGVYSFTGLYSGNYRVIVDTASVRETVPTADADGISTPNTATITLSASQSGVTSTDNFGYIRTNPHVISGTIYYDANINYVQDSGEPGIPSVTVYLDVDVNNDGVVDSTKTTTTNINGVYSFPNLYAGSYKIRVEGATLADDVIPTADIDGINTVHSAVTTVIAGGSNPVGNFGYMRSNPPGTGTRGYWVNHPAAWPVSSLYLGGVLYTKQQAIEVLQRATKGDVTYSMAAQLIATKLNLANGNVSSCITSTVVSADNWLAAYPIGSGVKGNSSAWSNPGSSLHNTLDDYNNGRMCAEHID